MDKANFVDSAEAEMSVICCHGSQRAAHNGFRVLSDLSDLSDNREKTGHEAGFFLFPVLEFFRHVQHFQSALFQAFHIGFCAFIPLQAAGHRKEYGRRTAGHGRNCNLPRMLHRISSRGNVLHRFSVPPSVSRPDTHISGKVQLSDP